MFHTVKRSPVTQIAAPLPVEVVTSASQLPESFLEPSESNRIEIGFDCEGVDLARHGKLCIMQLAWRDKVYLVDVVVGGSELVEKCRKGLESPYVTKVIHDCKRDSEALYFQFGIKLQGVFDTQVAYCMIEKSSVDSISFVNLLSDTRYCGFLYGEKQEIRDIMRLDESFWVHRPWTERMKRVASDDVRFLLLIKDRMCAELGGPMAERHLALLSALHCQCFCVGAIDWPLPQPGLEKADLVLSIVEVPPGMMGRVIGKKGASIRGIQENCRAACVFTGGKKGPNDKVFAIGPLREVKKAEAIIRGLFY